MKREVYIGKTMYAVFYSSENKGTYVQPCKVLKITKDGFIAECHNGGEDGHRKGKEYFSNESIGNGVYFSKDTAELKLKETPDIDRDR